MYLIAALQFLAQQVFNLWDENFPYLVLGCPIFEIGWGFDIAKSLQVKMEFLVSPTNILDGLEYTQSVSPACWVSLDQSACVLLVVMLLLEIVQPNANILWKHCAEA
jgi:hypothetical protein